MPSAPEHSKVTSNPPRRPASSRHVSTTKSPGRGVRTPGPSACARRKGFGSTTTTCTAPIRCARCTKIRPIGPAPLTSTARLVGRECRQPVQTPRHHRVEGVAARGPDRPGDAHDLRIPWEGRIPGHQCRSQSPAMDLRQNLTGTGEVVSEETDRCHLDLPELLDGAQQCVVSASSVPRGGFG